MAARSRAPLALASALAASIRTAVGRRRRPRATAAANPCQGPRRRPFLLCPDLGHEPPGGRPLGARNARSACWSTPPTPATTTASGPSELRSTAPVRATRRPVQVIHRTEAQDGRPPGAHLAGKAIPARATTGSSANVRALRSWKLDSHNLLSKLVARGGEAVLLSSATVRSPRPAPSAIAASHRLYSGRLAPGLRQRRVTLGTSVAVPTCTLPHTTSSTSTTTGLGGLFMFGSTGRSPQTGIWETNEDTTASGTRSPEAAIGAVLGTRALIGKGARRSQRIETPSQPPTPVGPLAALRSLFDCMDMGKTLVIAENAVGPAATLAARFRGHSTSRTPTRPNLEGDDYVDHVVLAATCGLAAPTSTPRRQEVGFADRCPSSRQGQLRPERRPIRRGS